MILAPLAKQRFYDNNNNPLNKGQLFCYIAGTTTKQTTYSDSAGTPNTNPVILNYRGECDLWLDTTKTYKFVLAPATDTDPPTNAFWTVDNIPGGYGGTINYTQVVYPQTAAEQSASVTPVSIYIPDHTVTGEVDVHRYGAKGDNTTDDLTAFNNAVLVATQIGDGAVIRTEYLTYRLTAVWKWPVTAQRWTLNLNGGTLRADHNGDCFDITCTNENYSKHVINASAGLLQGPNVNYPASAGQLAGTSTGAGLRIHDGTTSNAACGYGVIIKGGLNINGFKYGRFMRSILLCQMFGGSIRFNQYGDYWDGGQANGNHSWGVRIRENRVAGIWSAGTTGGSLTNSTANGYHGCEIETNLPYRGDNPGGFSGGYPTAMDTSGTLGVGVYLNNSYDFSFDSETYLENQNYSFVFANLAKHNTINGARLAGGGARFGGVKFVGAGVDCNKFMNVAMLCSNQTDANVESNHADHTNNQFLDCFGFNFISGSITGMPFVRNSLPELASNGGMTFGQLGVSSAAVVLDVAAGTTPGTIAGTGTGTATLYAQGYGEIGFGSGGIGASGSDTTITTINVGVAVNCFLRLRNYQNTRKVTIVNNGTTGPIVLAAGANKTLVTFNDSILFWITPLGHLVEVSNSKVGFSGAMVAGAVTVANTAVNGQSLVLATRQPGGTNAGAHWVDTITAGTGFTVKSTNGADTGFCAYEIK